MKKRLCFILGIMMLITVFIPLSHSSAAGEEVAPRAGIPVQGWVSGDGHSHTTYSTDGKNSVAEMTKAARDAGLNYLVVTDHNNSDAYANGDLAAHESNVMITTIWGQEYTKHTEGHATIMSMVPIRNYRHTGGYETVMPMKDMINEVHSVGGLAIAAHPFDNDYPMKVSGWEDYPWDAIEIWNGYYGGRHKATSYAMQYWDRKNRDNLENTDPEKNSQRVYGVAQSDLHETTYFGKTVYTKAYVTALNATNIFNAYKNGKIYGTNGPTLSFSINGKMMGEDVVLDSSDLGEVSTDGSWQYRASTLDDDDDDAPSTAKVTVRISGSYDKGLRRAILIHNKKRTGYSGFTGSDGKTSYSYSTQFQLNGATSFEREFTVEVAPGDFLRLELEGNDGYTLDSYAQETTGFAFSNPIFITEKSRTYSEMADLVSQAESLRTTSLANYSYTTIAVNSLNEAIIRANSVRTSMGGTANSRPGSGEINSAYNLLVKAMDDFKFFAKVPRTSQGWYAAPDGNVYYVKSDKFLATGLTAIGADRYYFSEQTGAAQLHWQRLGGNWYYFIPSGTLGEKGKAASGFTNISNKTYYFRPSPDNTMATGHQSIEGSYYYFNDSGAMFSGWLKAGDEAAGATRWYYFNEGDGKRQSGWLNLNGKDYFLEPGTGLTVLGMHVIDGRRYFFGNSGQRIDGGWQTHNDDSYYIENGQCVTGWKAISGKWYLFDADSKMLKGWAREGDKWYYLNGNGVMQTGWISEGDKWYYLGSGGDMKTGWNLINGRWYYMKGGGAMVVGWLKDGNTWYYLQSSGVMKVGWYQEGTKWYYLKPGGAMATGTLRIGNRNYTFSASGVWDGK